MNPIEKTVYCLHYQAPKIMRELRKEGYKITLYEHVIALKVVIVAKYRFTWKDE